jgi:nucleotide-binding universal stress UspA family protein
MDAPPDDPVPGRPTQRSKRARPLVVYALDERPAPASSVSQVAFFTRLYGGDLRIVRVTPRAASRRRNEARPASALGELVASEPATPIAFRVVDLGGPLRPTVVDYARSRHATLLVIDAQLGAAPGRVAGTVAPRLGRSAPCPVLVLSRPKRRQASKGAPLREVLCALDHGPASEATLSAALFLARRTRARLTLLHVLQGLPVPSLLSGMEAARVVRQCEALAAAERERLARLAPGRATRGLQIEYAVRTGPPERAIAQVAAEVGVQLIVLGVVPRNLVDEVLVGSTSRPVLRRAKVPVMLVPALPASTASKRRSGLARRPRYAGLR